MTDPNTSAPSPDPTNTTASATQPPANATTAPPTQPEATTPAPVPTIPGTDVDVPAYMNAIAQRIPPEEMPDVQRLIVEGGTLAVQVLMGKQAGIAAWRKKVDAKGPQLAAEIRGMVKGIAQQEAAKRVRSLLGQLDDL